MKNASIYNFSLCYFLAKNCYDYEMRKYITIYACKFYVEGNFSTLYVLELIVG